MKPDKSKHILPKLSDFFTNEKESKQAGKANYKKYKHTNLYKSSPSHDKALKKVNYTGTHEHSHNKGGLMGELKGLQATKHYGIKKGELKVQRKKAKEQKKRGEIPF